MFCSPRCISIFLGSIAPGLCIVVFLSSCVTARRLLLFFLDGGSSSGAEPLGAVWSRSSASFFQAGTTAWGPLVGTWTSDAAVKYTCFGAACSSKSFARFSACNFTHMLFGVKASPFGPVAIVLLDCVWRARLLLDCVCTCNRTARQLRCARRARLLLRCVSVSDLFLCCPCSGLVSIAPESVLVVVVGPVGGGG